MSVSQDGSGRARQLGLPSPACCGLTIDFVVVPDRAQLSELTVTEKFTEKLNLSSYAVYLSDIGGSIGFRLAVMHPERVTAMIVQNGDAHVEAINKEFLTNGLFAYWEDRSEKNAQVLLDWLLTIEGTKWF